MHAPLAKGLLEAAMCDRGVMVCHGKQSMGGLLRQVFDHARIALAKYESPLREFVSP
jgi:hypothetical protein